MLELATYPADLSEPRLATATLGPGSKLIVDVPGGSEEEPAAKQAGLLVVTPVVSESDRTAVVPPQKLLGSFTVGSPFNAFGENALARSVRGERNPGDLVDGDPAEYEPIRPNRGILVIPTYYNPSTLSPPELDGNRIVLIAFDDRYDETGFRIAPPESPLEVKPILCADSGRVEPDTFSVSGVTVTDLEQLAGNALPATGGSLFFQADSSSSNFFGLFSQASGHLGAGHRLSAARIVPPCPTPGESPPPPPPSVCQNGIKEPGEQCDGDDLGEAGGATCYQAAGGDDEFCPGEVRCSDDCRFDVSGCGPCICSADSNCRVDLDCEPVRPGCPTLGGVCDGNQCILVSQLPIAELERICGGTKPENPNKQRCDVR